MSREEHIYNLANETYEHLAKIQTGKFDQVEDFLDVIYLMIARYYAEVIENLSNLAKDEREFDITSAVFEVEFEEAIEDFSGELESIEETSKMFKFKE